MTACEFPAVRSWWWRLCRRLFVLLIPTNRVLITPSSRKFAIKAARKNRARVMPNHLQTPHRIFQVPELLSFVCRCASPDARTALLRVSHMFFNVAAPISWENVFGVHYILRLLSGATVTTETLSKNKPLILVVRSLPTLWYCKL